MIYCVPDGWVRLLFVLSYLIILCFLGQITYLLFHVLIYVETTLLPLLFINWVAGNIGGSFLEINNFAFGLCFSSSLHFLTWKPPVLRVEGNHWGKFFWLDISRGPEYWEREISVIVLSTWAIIYATCSCYIFICLKSFRTISNFQTVRVQWRRVLTSYMNMSCSW